MTAADIPLRREPIFKWDTVREIGPYVLRYETPVPGTLCEVELTSGAVIQAWKPSQGLQYFCHGFTFAGTAAPGAPLSPFTGRPVESILAGHFDPISPADAAEGDILVWTAPPPHSTPHSAVLLSPLSAHGTVDYGALLQTKNGMSLLTAMSLEKLILQYGEWYNAYRWRVP